MHEVKILVPEERIPEFYGMVGRWLAGSGALDADADTKLDDWQNTDDDLVLAKVVWGKLSERARALFNALINEPEIKFTGEQLASDLDIPNGKYGVAGVLAWPGRHCLAVGRHLPVKYEEGPVGGSANYWITTEVAALFDKARSGQ
jgi:hypothetical protein